MSKISIDNKAQLSVIKGTVAIVVINSEQLEKHNVVIVKNWLYVKRFEVIKSKEAVITLANKAITVDENNVYIQGSQTVYVLPRVYSAPNNEPNVRWLASFDGVEA